MRGGDGGGCTHMLPSSVFSISDLCVKGESSRLYNHIVLWLFVLPSHKHVFFA